MTLTVTTEKCLKFPECHSFNSTSYLFRLLYYFEKPREAMMYMPEKKHINIDPQCFTSFPTKEIPFSHLSFMFMLKDLSEAEEIKKRWQEYTELYKKCLNDPDNYDDIFTHL